jgi:hypothetical protein
MVSGSKSYQSVRPTERAMTPSEELRHWYDANKKVHVADAAGVFQVDPDEV